MLIFVQYLYGLTWAFSVAYARARALKRVCLVEKRGRVEPITLNCAVPRSYGENENIVPWTRVTLERKITDSMNE